LRAAAGVFIIALWSTAAVAAVTVTPASPTTSDPIIIRVENSFNSDANVTSASITQTGNAFIIQQNVTANCLSANAPVLVSQFAVSPLAPGTYSVTAHINVTNGCTQLATPQVTQFTVAAPVPVLDSPMLLLLAAVLGVAAVVSIKTPS